MRRAVLLRLMAKSVIFIGTARKKRFSGGFIVQVWV
jgi:hypothetical protein